MLERRSSEPTLLREGSQQDVTTQLDTNRIVRSSIMKRAIRTHDAIPTDCMRHAARAAGVGGLCALNVLAGAKRDQERRQEKGKRRCIQMRRLRTGNKLEEYGSVEYKERAMYRRAEPRYAFPIHCRHGRRMLQRIGEQRHDISSDVHILEHFGDKHGAWKGFGASFEG